MSLGCVYTNGLCHRLSERTRLNRLNQRDLSLQDSIAATFNPGVDLNSVVFDRYGYTLNSTSIVKDLLDVGLRHLYLDVFWDSEDGSWHLCPFRPAPVPLNQTGTTISPVNAASTAMTNNVSATPLTSEPLSMVPNYTYTRQVVRDKRYSNISQNGTTPQQQRVHCDYQLDFTTLIEAIEDYITLSDTNIAVSLLHLQLRPQRWLPSTAKPNQTEPNVPGETSLGATLQRVVGSRLLTPIALKNDLNTKKEYTTDGVWPGKPRDEQWPSLRDALYSDKRRLLVFYSNDDPQAVAELNGIQDVAFDQRTTIRNPQSYSVHELSLLNFTDSFVEDMQGWVTARRAGVSPILAGKIDVYSEEAMDLFNDQGSWAWASQQPPLYTIEQRERMLKNGYKDSQELQACAVYTQNGLVVGDCGHHYPVLCRNKLNSFDWRVSYDRQSYFDSSCPKGFHFGVPSSPLEARYVRELWHNNSVDGAWADFNSLFLPNCWVSGGTNAVCPYNVVQNDRNGIGYIAVAAAVAACLLAAIFMFEWDRGRSPLMRNSRTKDRKNSEFEGVPS